jgi:uncharacterized membrane protein
VIWLLLGILVFFGIHSVRMVAPGFRDAMIVRLGALGWKGLYAIISLGGFWLLVWGYGQARPDAPVLYTPGIGLKYVGVASIFVGFLLLGAVYLPTGRIKAAFRHPFNIGFVFISLGHMLANGNLATLVLAGATLIYSVLNTVSALSRPAAPPVPGPVWIDVLALAIGVAFFGLFAFWLHVSLFGIDPLGSIPL